MSRSVVSRLADETGISPVTNDHPFDGVEHLYFEPELSYESFAEAVARVNANTAYGMVVWSCGRSPDGRFVAAVQVFDALTERAEEKLAENDGIARDTYEGEYQSNERADRDAITTARPENNSTVLDE
ncbi:MAG: hypothetical protein ABEH61_04870 [Haloarculaceae archaeon]